MVKELAVQKHTFNRRLERQDSIAEQLAKAVVRQQMAGKDIY
jgi:hypothetical protein